ncbi:LpxI family protein [Pontibaca salina]|uniref:UDP-2,3-diacylglucosamine diphosphatase LpxI n=1 Tax=Pontibaca salina TaxID=2795731 RepID=A0A934HNS7_9RHOB|nr:UDP-2,3-diacylglucosamine diphosphatase LpxI [Pontibaca salina]MBI6630406.1 UDP-2,3-diacylglucosamine diphosphatase LpxI [Pontibaca salina]
MLALIVGSDDLPAALLAELDHPPLICALEGHAPDGIAVDILFRLERLGTFLADLSARGVREVCLAGAITRPKIDPQKIDAATMPLIPILQDAMMKGDDGALRAVIAIFEDAGFAIRPAHEIAPRLLPPPGCPTRRQVDQCAQADALRGAALVGAMSDVDVGQCCAVHNGQALAIEALFGTDWLLASLQDRPDGAGGILFKAPKTQQDRRVDLPAIGPRTVTGAARAGLDGIVIQAKGVLVLHRAQVIAECDRLGLFLWVRAN